MSAPVVPGGTERGAGPGDRGSRRWVHVGIVVIVAATAALMLLVVFHGEVRPVPAFPSLEAHPDPSLQGTVAYTTGESRCVRIVAAAGSPSRDVMCLGQWKPNPAAAAAGFKEMNSPQLVWRPDGRLEITMFLMQVGPYPKGQGPTYRAEWQKIVDIRTGAVEDVPAAQLPTSPNLTTRPTTTPSGRRITWTSNGETGRVTVTITESTGSRNLMSAHGPGGYGYALHSAFWSPNWQWIAADDGRILIITPGPPSLTRVLVDGGGGGGDFPIFAVTAQNLLGGAG